MKQYKPGERYNKMKKMKSEASDKTYDKKHSIKENSKGDKKQDKKMGVKQKKGKTKKKFGMSSIKNFFVKRAPTNATRMSNRMSDIKAMADSI